jgi:hypothetical protein
VNRSKFCNRWTLKQSGNIAALRVNCCYEQTVLWRAQIACVARFCFLALAAAHVWPCTFQRCLPISFCTASAGSRARDENVRKSTFSLLHIRIVELPLFWSVRSMERPGAAVRQRATPGERWPIPRLNWAEFWPSHSVRGPLQRCGRVAPGQSRSLVARTRYCARRAGCF